MSCGCSKTKINGLMSKNKKKSKIRGLDADGKLRAGNQLRRVAVAGLGFGASEYAISVAVGDETDGKSNRGLYGGIATGVGIGVSAFAPNASQDVSDFALGIGVSGIKNLALALAPDAMKSFGIHGDGGYYGGSANADVEFEPRLQIG
jgi:hypothetical protein